MNEEPVTSDLEKLRLQVAAHQTVLQVLLAMGPESIKAELIRMAEDFEDATLPLPIPEQKREIFSEILRKLGAPKA